MKRFFAIAAMAIVALVAPAAAQGLFNARAVVSASSSGDNTIIAAVAGKRISIYGLDLALASVTTVTLKSGSTALTGAMTMNGYSKPILQGGPAYWTGGVGEAFIINLGSGVQLSGAVWYSQQ